ncbi:putative integral membrane protein [Mycobacterium tuberculosis]|nr:putative integral membrane protein [Mycobacterium tuberculosis]
MSAWRAPEVGSRLGRRVLWCLLWLLAGVALGYVAWRLFGHTPYRIDIDIYQMGARAWLDGRPLYGGGVLFHTPIGLNLRSPILHWRPSCSAHSPGCRCRLPASRSRC